MNTKSGKSKYGSPQILLLRLDGNLMISTEGTMLSDNDVGSTDIFGNRG